jgi:hypothetical protein
LEAIVNPETLSNASILERFRAVWASMFAITVLFVLSAGVLIQASEAAKHREIAAQSLLEILNDRVAISALKNYVDKIRPLTEHQVVIAEECRPSLHLPLGQIAGAPGITCGDFPIQATDIVDRIYNDINQLEVTLNKASALAKSAMLASNDGWSAYADTPTGVGLTNVDKTIVVYAVIALLFLMTGACFWTVLSSHNTKAVTWSIHALNTFIGFYVGLLTSFFR